MMSESEASVIPKKEYGKSVYNTIKLEIPDNIVLKLPT